MFLCGFVRRIRKTLGKANWYKERRKFTTVQNDVWTSNSNGSEGLQQARKRCFGWVKEN